MYTYVMITSLRKRGESVSAKMGRPVEGEPKNSQLHFRTDKATISKLNECSERLKVNRSEVIRMGIEEIHKQVTQKK